MVVGCFVFESWNDAVKKKEYGNSVMWFLESNQIFKASGISHFHNLNKESESGTQKGDIIEIAFFSDKISKEEILKVLVKSGIILRPADPFEKPIKTLWQVIKDWFV